ncbi:MAG: hypothetical protein Q7R51_01835 [bacterium]|nr:hypothetical protein [bacterium]
MLANLAIQMSRRNERLAKLPQIDCAHPEFYVKPPIKKVLGAGDWRYNSQTLTITWFDRRELDVPISPPIANFKVDKEAYWTSASLGKWSQNPALELTFNDKFKVIRIDLAPEVK